MDQTANASTYHMDPASGTVAAFATLAALRRRERSGTGELVEVAQAENLLNHIGDHLVDAAVGGGGRRHDGNRHPTFAPQGCYPCDGVDRWVVIGVEDDAAWLRLCELIDAADLGADVELRTAAGRRRRHDEIDARIAGWTAGLDRWEAARQLQAAGIAAGPVLGDADCWADPHLRSRGFFRENGSEDLPSQEFPGHLWRWDGPPLRWDPINRLGADNDDVLRDVAGLDDGELAALQASGQLRLDYVDGDGSPL
jgi:crotonobetainyl-CoA:carnitine CoA-transferase CaiB-like acyl-CoA transferase